MTDFETVNVLRAMRRSIDADLSHCGYCFESYVSGPCAGTLNFEPVSGVMPQESFRHLTSCRVSGAEYQHALFLPFTWLEHNDG